MSKILLITYHPLLSVNGGTIMYKSIIEKIGKDKLYWIATGAESNKAPIWMDEFEKLIFPSIIFSKKWKRIFLKPFFRIIHNIILYNIYVYRCKKKISTIIAENKIQKVWIEGVKQNFKLAYLLSESNDIKIHLSINDNYSANTSILERLFLEKYFKWGYKNSNSIDFISEGMTQYYESKYGLIKPKHKIFWIGGNIMTPNPPKVRKCVSKIIFYGNIHGLDAIKSFCSCIDIINSSKANNPIQFDIYSDKNYSHLSYKFKCVNYKGFIDINSLANLLREYDLVYVPYSFRKDYRITAMTSLPSKILLALQCRIPILAHGPSYGQNIIFTEKFGIGFVIKTKEKESIIEIFNRIDYSSRKSVTESLLNTYNMHFKVDAKIDEFIEFIFD